MDPGNDTENKYQLDDMEYVGTKHRIRKRNTSKPVCKNSDLVISAYQQADT